mmetsp:Transcript_98968/g.206270  ORF Transcript_98968/g.206270 Transcript_98968/m.206270 type:complete len:541 (-) Transcript_98968:450-2072(-)
MENGGRTKTPSAWQVDSSRSITSRRLREFSRDDNFEDLIARETGALNNEEIEDVAEDGSANEETSLLALCVRQDGNQPGRKRPTFSGWLRGVARSDSFKLVMGLIIVANTFCMAVQIDHPTMGIELFGVHFRVWFLLNSTFLTIFCLEIALRLWAEGCTGYFYSTDDWAWNLFDFLVVAFGVADQLLFRALPYLFRDEATAHAHQGEERHRASWAVMAARTLRIVRVLRVVRIFRAFRKLRMLVRGMLESVEVVFWIMVLCFLMIFICAILCTTLIGQSVGKYPPEERPDIDEWFGSVGKSMFTLFQCLTMDGWSGIYATVTSTQPGMTAFFFPFMFIGAFVIMSLLTGVMADHMNDVRRNEEEEETKERLSQIDTAIQAVKSSDVDGDGTLDRYEFEKLFDPGNSFAKDLKDTGVSISSKEAVELFDCFDVDWDGKVDYEELSHAIKHLQTGLGPLTLFRLGASIRAAERFMSWQLSQPNSEKRWKPCKVTDDSLHKIDRMDQRLVELEKMTDNLELECRKFMEKFDWQPSTGSVSEDD